MAAQREKFLHFVKFRRGNLREGIFLRVHDAGLQRRIDFRQRHGRRIRPVVLEHLYPPDSAGHSQLDPFQILRLYDRPHIVVIWRKPFSQTPRTLIPFAGRPPKSWSCTCLFSATFFMWARLTMR